MRKLSFISASACLLLAAACHTGMYDRPVGIQADPYRVGTHAEVPPPDDAADAGVRGDMPPPPSPVVSTQQQRKPAKGQSKKKAEYGDAPST